MIVSGKECPQQADAQEVAERTVRCLRRAVPAAVPGVVFLSGGQDEQVATQHLAAICKAGDVPWKVSFSFGRALQAPAIKIWQGLRAMFRRLRKLFVSAPNVTVWPLTAGTLHRWNEQIPISERSHQRPQGPCHRVNQTSPQTVCLLFSRSAIPRARSRNSSTCFRHTGPLASWTCAWCHVLAQTTLQQDVTIRVLEDSRPEIL
jgi:hypothetical protein